MINKAKESAHIHKARERIKQQLIAANKKFNPEAIKAMSKLIHQQISRRSPERIPLEKREIVLFDENKHSAEVESKFINRLLLQLKQQKTPKAKLEGRIKKS